MTSLESNPDINEFTSSGGTDECMDGRASGADGCAEEPKTSWADERHVEDELHMPDSLMHLIKNGVHFKFAKSWSDTDRPHLVKNLSVYFSVDGTVTSENILQAFDDAGVDIDEITGIQRKTSNRTWVVSFASQLAKETALEVASIQVAGSTVFLGDCENRLVLVKIFEAPSELPDTAVIGCLSHYGRVLSFRRDKVFQVIENGVRTARMRIDRHIPSVVNLAGELVRIWYPNQPKTCRNCGSPDHLVKECQSVRCFNCECPGHRAELCTQPKRCTICREDGHEVQNCPFLIYSANVEVPGDELSKEEKEKVKQQEKEKYKAKVENARRKQLEFEKQQHHMQMACTNKDQSQDHKTDRTKEKEQNKSSERDNGMEDKKRENQDDGGDDKRGEKRARSSRSASRDKHREKRERSGDERERKDEKGRDRKEEREWRDRKEFEAWKEDKRREKDRQYSRRDYHRDRSTRRGDYSDEDSDDEGWTQVSYRRGRRHDR